MSRDASALLKALRALVIVVALLFFWREIISDEGDLALLMFVTILAPLFLGPFLLRGGAKN